MDIKLVAVLILGTTSQILGWRPFIVELQNSYYKSFHPEIVDFNVTIKNKVALDVHVNIVKDISQMFLDFEILRDSGNGTYDMIFINKTLDLCMSLNNRKSNPFFDITYRIFADYGNLPQKCPIRKKRYKLLDVFFDPEKFPPVMPDHRGRAAVVGWRKENGKRKILLKVGFDVEIRQSFKNNGK